MRLCLPAAAGLGAEGEHGEVDEPGTPEPGSLVGERVTLATEPLLLRERLGTKGTATAVWKEEDVSWVMSSTPAKKLLLTEAESGP